MPITSPRFLDLFAGCGGLTAGMAAAGWTHVAAVEKSPMAAATYSANHIVGDPLPDASDPHGHTSRPLADQLAGGLAVCGVEEVAADPQALEFLDAAAIDAVVGGPPCQGFSHNGRRWTGDPRDELVWPMLDIVERIAPRFVVIENVIGMAASKDDGPPVFDAAASRLAELGYGVQPCVVDAAQYGVPQRRRRVLLIADLNGPSGIRAKWVSTGVDTLFGPPLLAPAPTTPTEPITVGQALLDLDADGYTGPPGDGGLYGQTAAGRWRAARRGDVEAPLNHQLSRHTDRVLARYRLLHAMDAAGMSSKVIGQAAKANDPSLLAHLDRLEVAGVCRPGESVAEAAWRLRSKKRTQTVLTADEPAPTLGTQPQDWVHPREPRGLSVREYARLQGFDDGFELRGKAITGGLRRRFEVPTYSQIGNAVPPLLGQAIGSALLDAAEGAGVSSAVGTTLAA